jgi:Brp/Blh family beta-carotene 15,15'-monooxygenase
MKVSEYRLFSAVRTFSSISVAVAIALSLIFSQSFGADSIQWQIAIAIAALAIGIPHGALDHLVTIPRSKPATMAIFILIYIAVAIIAFVAILKFNVIGFIFVLVMSATHFGIGDAAFINEIDRRSDQVRKLPRTIYAICAGSIPVFIPLVNSASTDALAQVNPSLIDWHQGFDQEILRLVTAIGVIGIFVLIFKSRRREALDISLLLVLALTAPPLIAFAVYFGCWHAMRHTARLTLSLDSCQATYAEGNLKKTFLAAVIPGVPALIGTFVIAGILAIFGRDFDDDFFWMALVVVWALTVPHMAVTAKLDRAALT